VVTPQHWHALATIWACQAGKDVYVEKCISHNIFEGQKMIEAAMKYERVVQCGMQNRSAAFVRSARDYIESGELGEIFAIHLKHLQSGPVPFNLKEDEPTPDTIDWDMWLGPAPSVPYSVSRNKSWGQFWDYSGGLQLGNDMIHQLDMTRMILGDPGLPGSVYCTGGRYFFDDGREIPDYQMATFDFGDHVMTFETGDCAAYMKKTPAEIRFSEQFPDWMQNTSRVEILGSNRMMYVGRMGGGWQVFDKEGEIVAQESGYFPLEAHMSNFIDCVRSREQPNSDIVEGHKSSVFVHLANLSYREGGKQLVFDPETETFLNTENAGSLLTREYRKGFEIPVHV
jgi:predicted dehydrogenase